MRVFFIALFFVVFCFGCKKHIDTGAICDGKLYLELFNVNRFGVDEKFIRDSLTFKQSLGKYDNEHEQLVTKCSGDTIIVEKWDVANETFKSILLERKKLLISDLKKEGRFK
jgi:hypothetical protein